MSTVCPHCGYIISTGQETAKTVGGVAVVATAAAAACFLFGGPIGAALGGGIAGKLANTAYNRTTKIIANKVMLTCPHCGKRFDENPTETPNSESKPVKKWTTTMVDAAPKGPMTHAQIIDFLRSVGINNPQAFDYFIKHPEKIHDRGWIHWAQHVYS